MKVMHRLAFGICILFNLTILIHSGTLLTINIRGVFFLHQLLPDGINLHHFNKNSSALKFYREPTMRRDKNHDKT